MRICRVAVPPGLLQVAKTRLVQQVMLASEAGDYHVGLTMIILEETGSNDVMATRFPRTPGLWSGERQDVPVMDAG